MYCRNCGAEMDPNAAVCVNCGVPAGKGEAHCQNCGQQTYQGASVCTHCGAALNRPVFGPQKSKLAAGLLGILLGSLGIHNFYLGYTTKGIIQLLLTLLTCGFGAIISSIWGLIEGVMILTGSISTDANGVPMKE